MKRNYQKELENICNELADSVLEMTDDEITEEINQEGGDPEAVRQLLLNSVKASGDYSPNLETQKHQN